MSTGFFEREEAMESRFGHDEELKFKVRSRRNFLFGCWVGQQMGLDSPSVEGYASNIVKFATQEAGDQALVLKVHQDLDAHKASYTLHQVHTKLTHFQDDAFQELVCGS